MEVVAYFTTPRSDERHETKSSGIKIPAVSVILDGELFLGSVAANDEECLKRHGIKAILNCAEEFSPPKFLDKFGVEEYMHLKLKDSPR